MIPVSLARAARWAGLPEPALDALTSFVDAGVLDALDVHVSASLAGRLGVTDGDVILAAALAVRAPRRGHVCVDLGALKAEDLLPEPDDDTAPIVLPPLPVDREAWVARVAASPLVRGGDDGVAPFVLRGRLLSTDRYDRYEDRLLQAFRARFAATSEVGDVALFRKGLAALFPATEQGVLDRQRLAAANALLRSAVVVSGGPGTGKTWTVRNVLTLLYAQWAANPEGRARPRIALAAPTGKAAARVVESIRVKLDDHLKAAPGALPENASVADLSAFLTDAEPMTLHRLLGWRPDDPTRFRHHAGNPLPYDVVIVDEASMVDLALMSKLVDAVPLDARLVLLGDRNQLASVEAGTVLADLCGVGAGGGDDVRLSADAVAALRDVAGIDVAAHVVQVPEAGPWDAVVFLTQSRRFTETSGIGVFARATVCGDAPAALDALPPWPASGPGRLVLGADGKNAGPDIGRLAAGERGALTPALQNLVRDGYRPYLDTLRAGPAQGESLAQHHAAVLKALDGFRVLAAHRRGRLGVEGLNRAIAALLTDDGAVVARGTWYEGRPVLVTRNDYAVGRFNGDVGVVVRNEAGELVVAFPAEAPAVEEGVAEGSVPPSDPKPGVTYLATVRMPDHDTVFAMTIHKSQGSEFDDVLVVLPEARSPVLTRELLYTGVTRAKHRVTVLGGQRVIEQTIAHRVERASGLAGALWGEGT